MQFKKSDMLTLALIVFLIIQGWFDGRPVTEICSSVLSGILFMFALEAWYKRARPVGGKLKFASLTARAVYSFGYAVIFVSGIQLMLPQFENVSLTTFFVTQISAFAIVYLGTFFGGPETRKSN